jgi:hypothetical protein
VKDKINVGISIAYTESTNIWNSGLNQNLAFLVLLLRKVPEVGEVYLLNQGAAQQLPPGLGFEQLGVKLVPLADAAFDVDLVIEMGATLPLEWLRHVRALGARIVTFYVGNAFLSQAEPAVFQRPAGAPFAGTPWHEIWTLPQYAKTSAPLLATIGRVPVHTLPHIWSPMFLRRQAEELARAGHIFGFEPASAREGWRAAIFEPNISVAKACFIPMLACDHAYRTRPESMRYMMVLNSVHMKEHPTFNRLAAHLDLTRASKASYEPRLAFAECMAVHKMNAVVSHQWENAQNYIYYEALYGGYPLVHNSPLLRGVGYYYPDFDCKAGGQALLRAFREHDGNLPEYRQQAKDVLAGLDVANPANIETYTRELLALFPPG